MPKVFAPTIDTAACGIMLLVTSSLAEAVWRDATTTSRDRFSDEATVSKNSVRFDAALFALNSVRENTVPGGTPPPR